MEYFLLTAVIVLLFLGFARLDFFKRVKTSCENSLDNVTDTITGGEYVEAAGS